MTDTLTGVVIGLITDVDDPLGQGRVQIKLPWLSDDPHGWAPVASPMAGEKRGYWFRPEVGDEALVTFLQGDGDHPFVIGFLHNGVDVPPSDGIDQHVRRVRSVAGHVVDLDDRSGQEKVRVRTNGGHVLELRDSDATIALTTSGGQQVTLQDTPAQIELTTDTGTKVILTDAPSEVRVSTVGGVSLAISDTGVTLTAATAPVTVTAPSATLTTTGALSCNATAISLTGAAVSVNSAVTTFSGVVACQSLIASAVVSSSYTPGVGNLL
ncbi:phage baseplate assembly protein V [Flexivirga alba]|uniref:Phage baseplate assembly protein V n=1 Tax=Flexivirga alba TaxID=702742 RepID=A0ABW2AG38_9MICO